VAGSAAYIPDDMDELATSLVLLVAAVGRRPLAGHDRRLTAVLSVPDSVQRMIERLDADDSPLCATNRDSSDVRRVLRYVSWSLTSLFSTNMAISQTNGHSL